MKNHRSKHRKGFTLIELMLSLMIAAMLLTAIAVAFNASVDNYLGNKNHYTAINQARQALMRMTTQLRTSYVDPSVTALNRCRLLCQDGSDISYHFEAADNKLYLLDHATNTDYVLCENVTDLTFTKDTNTPTGDVKNVQISITVQVGSDIQTLASAVVIRKVL
jgi:prepilin-type N-terminal cleavage/methylation domain-containing protein